MKFDEVIKKRQSIRNYSTKKVSWNQLLKVLEAARLSPSAGNIYTIKLIIVNDKEKIAGLAKAANQDFISDSSYVIIVCSDNEQITRSYDERGIRYSGHQAGAAIENMLLKITDLGLASCWVGAFSDTTVRRICKIPEKIEVEALLPVAHPFGKEKARKVLKPDLQNIVFFERYGQKTKEKSKDVTMRIG